MGHGAAEPGEGARPRRTWRRRLLLGAGALVLVLLVLVALAPMIAGSIVPGIAARRINEQIRGHAEVRGASFGWFGGQKLGPVIISTPDGRPVADIEVHISSGLASLARAGLGWGRMDLGTITLRGAATVVRQADGTTSLQEAIEPRGPRPVPSAPGEVRLPRSLSARVVLDQLTLRYLDEARPANLAAAFVELPDVNGEIVLSDSRRATIELAAPIRYGSSPSAALTGGGTLAIRGSADSLTDATGRLTPERLRIDATADATDIAVVALDALAGLDNRLVAALGERLQASLRAAGSLADGTLSADARSPASRLDVQLRAQDGIITAARPGVFELDTQGLAALIPGGDLQIDQFPRVRATIEDLRVPGAALGGAMDLRGAGLTVTVETDEVAGRVRVPDVAGDLRPFRVQPLRARLAAADLSSGATLQATTAATLDGQSAGTLRVDLNASGLLDASGRPAAVGRLEGVAEVTGLATAIAEPLVPTRIIDLRRDVGPELNIALRAQTAGDAAPGAGDLSSTGVTLDITSANLKASARATLAQNIVRAEGEAVHIRMETVAPLASRALADAGVQVESGGPLTITVSDASVDLRRYRRGGAAGAPADLRAVSGTVRAELAGARGRLALPDQPVRGWQLSPATAAVDARDLAAGAALTASAGAQLDGRPAGELTVDLRARRLLDASGAARAGLPALSGRAEFRGVSTAIAQPFVEGAGLDLPRGIGPRVDVLLTADAPASEGGQSAEGAQATVDLQVRSDGLTADAALAMAGRTLRTRGEGISVSMRSPAALAAGAARRSGVELSGEGFARASVKNVLVAWDESGRLDASRLTAEAEGATGNMTVRPLGDAGAEPIALQQVFLVASLKEGAPARVELRGSGSHGGGAFFARTELDLPGAREVLAAASAGEEVAARAAQLRPLGEVELRNIPTPLLTMALAAPDEGEMGVRRLVQEAIGPAISVNLSAAARAGAGPEARDVTLAVRSARMQGDASAGVDAAALEVRGAEFTASVTPEVAAAVLGALGRQVESTPRLAAPASAKLTISPVTIPMQGLAPQLARAGDATVRLELAGPATVRNVVLAAAEDRPARDIGPLGARDVLVTATVPLASLAADTPARPASAEVTATLLGGPQQVIATLSANARMALASGRPSGPAEADFDLGVLDTARLDAILDRPGFVSGAVGERLGVKATARVEFAPAGAAAGAPAFTTAGVRATITSPMLNSTQPLVVTATPRVLSLDQAAVLNWRVNPGWANEFLPRPGQPGQKPMLVVTEPVDVKVSLFKLALAMGEGEGPMKPGVFAADAELAVPAAKLDISGVPTPVRNLRVRGASGREPNVLGFSLVIDDVGGGAPPAGGPAVNFEGGLYGIADAAGNPAFGTAKLTAAGAAHGFPTAVIDAAASQDGLLVEALGPAVTMTAEARGASMDGGQVSAKLVSARAEADLRGIIRDHALISQGPVTATLREITPQLGARLTRGVPLIGEFQKLATDAPATVHAEGLTVPLDGDLARLNGRIAFDPGEARWTTSTAFARLLQVVGRREGGVVGRRLEPLEVTINDGVATYARYSLPLGEFTVETRGTVNLVSRQMDVVTYVPFGALTDEAAGVLNTGLGGVLGGALPGIEKATMVPIRTSGSFEQPHTRVDLELFIKEAGSTLLRPDKIIGGALEDVLEKVRPNKPK